MYEILWYMQGANQHSKSGVENAKEHPHRQIGAALCTEKRVLYYKHCISWEEIAHGIHPAPISRSV